jgi:hypothetical protein
LLHDGCFELLFIDPQKFIDLKFDILTDPQPFGIEVDQCSRKCSLRMNPNLRSATMVMIWPIRIYGFSGKLCIRPTLL